MLQSAPLTKAPCPMRSLSSLSSMLLVLSLLTGCYTNPHPTDGPVLQYATQLTSSDLTPGLNDGVTLSFSIQSLAESAINNVPWIIFLDGDLNAVVASGTIGSIPGGGITPLISSAVPAPAGGGTHIYTADIDPSNLLLQRDTASNFSSLTLTFADFDLSIDVPPSLTHANPTTTTPITVSFSILNTDTSGNGTTAVNVGYQVLEGLTILASGTVTSIAANASVGVDAVIPAATAGLHEYTVVINPGDVILEQDYTNDSMSVDVTIPVAN